MYTNSVLCHRVFLPLLKRDQHGRLVVIIRTAAHNPQLHLQNNVLKVGKMTLDLAVEMDESISVYGVTAIFDLNAITFSHATQMTPSIIKKAVHAWQVCLYLMVVLALMIITQLFKPH